MAWTISSPYSAKQNLGTLVSSLYGAPRDRKAILRGSLGIRMPSSNQKLERGLAFTDIPKSFNLSFRQKAAYLQGSALPLSYSRIQYPK